MIHYCMMCGKPMEGVGSNRKFCDKCRLQRKKDDMENRRKPQTKKQKEKPQTLAEKIRAADKLGMSYGQYVESRANAESHFSNYVHRKVIELEEFQ